MRWAPCEDSHDLIRSTHVSHSLLHTRSRPTCPRLSSESDRQLTAVQATILALDLLPENIFQGDCVGSELRDPFPQFLHSHGLFVEVEAEQRFVIDVGFFWNVELLRVTGNQFLREVVRRVVQLFE